MSVQLKPKVVLKEKGQAAALTMNSQGQVELAWTSEVDLDLMIFGTAQDGQTIAVFSNLISGNIATMGNTTAFPFMKLSEDAGVGAQGGDNSEDIAMTSLDHIQEVYVVTLNYTDASKGNAVSFSAYDGKVTITSDAGDNLEVPLDATEQGHVAVIAKIVNANRQIQVINENRIISLQDALAQIPGFNQITK